MSQIPLSYTPPFNPLGNFDSFNFPNIGLDSLGLGRLADGFGGIGLGFLGPFAAYMSQSYLFNMIALSVIGLVLGWAKTIYAWVASRVKYQLTVVAHVSEGDPAFEWVVNLLTQENIWHRSCEYQVSAKSSARKRAINSNANFLTNNDKDDKGTQNSDKAAADYIPSWTIPQVFRWKGYVIEVFKNGQLGVNVGLMPQYTPMPPPPMTTNSITLVIYTLRMSVLADLIEEAKRRYVEAHKPHVIIHTYDGNHGGAPAYDSWGNPTGALAGWGSVKQKPRRPVSSVVLPYGTMDTLVEDARDFLDTEEWYHELGIPHRRGYLLYGPPGTGKTSTIYSLAGELGLEIFSLSLASGTLNDATLQNAVNATPKRSILLIEDIDCAFPVRREDESDSDSDDSDYSDWGAPPPPPGGRRRRRSRRARYIPPVSMSGLLNVLDGVGSDEGKIFFATTNYVDRLDAALIRPGRIDRKIEYKLASQFQARSLFLRFFSTQKSPKSSKNADGSSEKQITGIGNRVLRHDPQQLAEHATEFSLGVPENEFSTAQLQGYLLIHKRDPRSAAQGIKSWVEEERAEKRRKERREQEKKDRKRKRREERKADVVLDKITPRFDLDAGGPTSFTLAPSAGSAAAFMPMSLIPPQPTPNGQEAPVPDIPVIPEVQVNGKVEEPAPSQE